MKKRNNNGSVISSYLKPLQFIGEDDYNQWQPRIKAIKSTRIYRKPKNNEILHPDGSVNRSSGKEGTFKVPSPGKPPPNNANKEMKEQYIKDLQKFIVKEAKKYKNKHGQSIYKPFLNNETINLVNHPVSMTLSSTSQTFEFKHVHQYIKYQNKSHSNSYRKSSASNKPGDNALHLSSTLQQKGNTVATWLHRKGATVFNKTIPRYTTDDGKEMYFFHTHTLHEQESPSPLPKAYPSCLHDIGLLNWFHDPIPPLIHNDTSLHVNITRHPEIHLIPAPLLKLQTDKMNFLVGKNAIEREPAMNTKHLKPPYLPPVFLLRYASSDTRSLYDFRYDALDVNVKLQSFELDWQRMNENDYLSLHLNKHRSSAGASIGENTLTTDDLSNLKIALYKSYDTILRAHKYYSASGDGTIRGIQLNAFRSFLKDTQIDKIKIGHGKAAVPLKKTKMDQLFINVDSSLEKNTSTSKSNIDESTAGLSMQQALVRYEFMLLLILLSNEIYQNKAIDHAFNIFISQNVIQKLNPDLNSSRNSSSTKVDEHLKQILQDQDDFREHRLYTRSVNMVFQHFLPGLHRLFLKYSGNKTLMNSHGVQIFLSAIEKKKKAKKRWMSLKKKRKSAVMSAASKGTLIKKKVVSKMLKGNKKSSNKSFLKKIQKNQMSKQFIRDVSRADAVIALAGYFPVDGQLFETLMPLESWIAMLHDISLIGQGLSIREATWCFTWSAMHKKDELKDKIELSFTDFLEAFGRLAELVPMPTMKEILMKTTNRLLTSTNNDEDQFNPSDRLVKYVSKHKNILSNVRRGVMKRRDSSNSMLVDSKHRSLDEKLFVMLSVVWEKIEDEFYEDGGRGGASIECM
jgi:hypothetical protein